jgi:hypothetical protein
LNRSWPARRRTALRKKNRTGHYFINMAEKSTPTATTTNGTQRKKRKRRRSTKVKNAPFMINARQIATHAIAPMKPFPPSINSFTLPGKEQLAVNTTNYTHWLLHVSAACALRRVQYEREHPELHPPLLHSPLPSDKKTKEKVKTKGRTKKKKNLTNGDAGALNTTHKKSEPFDVEVLAVDVDQALALLESDTSFNDIEYAKPASEPPKTVASTFLQRTTSAENAHLSDDFDFASNSTINPFFIVQSLQ